jgi:hypothetical protein
VSRWFLGPIQPPNQRYLRPLTSVKQTCDGAGHSHNLVRRLRIRGAIPPIAVVLYYVHRYNFTYTLPLLDVSFTKYLSTLTIPKESQKAISQNQEQFCYMNSYNAQAKALKFKWSVKFKRCVCNYISSLPRIHFTPIWLYFAMLLPSTAHQRSALFQLQLQSNTCSSASGIIIYTMKISAERLMNCIS